jgi:hypothetical protein
MTLVKLSVFPAAVATGVLMGQPAAGGVLVIGVMAIVLAAANGYSKAYSP